MFYNKEEKAMSSSKKDETEMVATINQADVEEHIYPPYPVFSKLNKKFELLELDDND